MENLEVAQTALHRIIIIRGHRVMLDFDLAALYEVQTGALNRAVRRNPDRFPSDFMIVLTREEILRLCQFGITSAKGAELKFSPRVTAFTEHGVGMLSSVLRSLRAVQVNIQIVRAFARLRRMVAETEELAGRLDRLERHYDGQFKTVFDAIEELREPLKTPPKKIGFGA